MLAELDVPLKKPATPTDNWQVNSAQKVIVNEERRPFLVPLGLLQTWQLSNLPDASGAAIAVEHSQGSYAIVAAGKVTGNVNAQQPGYNGLRATVSAAGQLNVTFTNYRQPDGSFQYIIKVLPMLNTQNPIPGNTVKVPVVNFDHFEPANFVLRVTDGGTPIPQAQLTPLEFMIEVSQFPFS